MYNQIFACAVSLAVLLTVPSSGLVTNLQPNDSLLSVFDPEYDSVVSLRFQGDQVGGIDRTAMFGTGVILKGTDYVLTAAHLVEQWTETEQAGNPFWTIAIDRADYEISTVNFQTSQKTVLESGPIQKNGIITPPDVLRRSQYEDPITTPVTIY